MALSSQKLVSLINFFSHNQHGILLPRVVSEPSEVTQQSCVAYNVVGDLLPYALVCYFSAYLE